MSNDKGRIVGNYSVVRKNYYQQSTEHEPSALPLVYSEILPMS